MKVFSQPLVIDGTYEFDVDTLADRWEGLHGFDNEPFPGVDYLAALIKAHPAVAASYSGFDGDVGAWSMALIAGWQQFHRGDFAGAFATGRGLGFPGYSLAHIAACAYTDVVTLPREVAAPFFRECAAMSAEAAAAMPRHANSAFYQGLFWGRYSEAVSLLKAATEQVVPKFTRALDHTLAVEPDHVLAVLAYGAYHASVVATVGGMMAKLTYGATRDRALDYFERGLALAPHLPSVYLEYGKGLVLLKDSRASYLFTTGASLTPNDAMEELDVRSCQRWLAQLAGR